MRIEEIESQVRFYCRVLPQMFTRAEGARLYDAQGRSYIDFLSGAGALNYGHNHPHLIQAVMSYLTEGGVLHSLDMKTAAKQRFLSRFSDVVLKPRGMAYQVQFTGPTGTNAVEAALKLARKVTGRTQVVAFTNAYHGVSVGSLSTTASRGKRAAAGVPLEHVLRMPFDGFLGGQELAYMERMLSWPGCGVEPPAAIILETVQGEGGLNTASVSWLQGVQRLARRLGALLIIDDIQAGCGRVSDFFSFERAGLQPDLVCLSKALGGLGLPLSVVLIAPQHDVWLPGEHNGTFRGNNLAFVAGSAAMDLWEEDGFQDAVLRNRSTLSQRLAQLSRATGGRAIPRGLGLLTGLKLPNATQAAAVQAHALEGGVVLETCGPTDSVVKIVPPLNIDTPTLQEGLDVVEAALKAALLTPTDSPKASENGRAPSAP